MPYLLLSACPQAAISAMNLEQQLSQYAFFNQQPSNQNQQVSHPPPSQLNKDISSEQREQEEAYQHLQTCCTSPVITSKFAARVCCLLADRYQGKIRNRGLINPPPRPKMHLTSHFAMNELSLNQHFTL